MSIPEESKEFVTSLARGLSVIKVFNQAATKLSLSEVARLSELNRATARRFLFTLSALGYVESDGKLFWLSPKVLQLGYSYLASQPIVNIVQPFIEQVSKETGESCSVSVLDGSEVVYIARYMTHHIMSVNLGIGARLPVAATSMGRVLLAYKSPEEQQAFLENYTPERYTPYTLVERHALMETLAQVRVQGYAIVNQELELGLRSISVPIMNQREQVVAAINVSTQPTRTPESVLLERILPSLNQAAKRIYDRLPV
ncbi:IclR family transcriptional regulator [Entomohabitans teleogrylli]|uniref:IclR family transcriptional regulator n=1 Tax=Entomohabitans teleogrylli TaxID=1384589 RepID=UPI00073D8F72|nr:IclR family transcriptional regulator [Entomohabitans teleogrylli]